MVKRVEVLALQRVLVKRVAHPAADAQILDRLKNSVPPGMPERRLRSRPITWVALSFLCASGLSPMNIRAELTEPACPPPKAVTLSTAGSFMSLDHELGEQFVQ